MPKVEMDIERLLQWAYRDELSKRHTSAAEGIWDRIMHDAQRGGIDVGQGAAQRYAHFGLPDPDAEVIERAVGFLQDLIIDWCESNFQAVVGELAGLITVNDMPRQSIGNKTSKVSWGPAGEKAHKAWWGESAAQKSRDRPRDVLMVGGIRTAVLVTTNAVKGTRPDWSSDPCRPRMTPALKGPNAMIVGECKGRNLYTAGSHCPLVWEPSPLSVVSSRAEYLAWHQGLVTLAKSIDLAKFIALPPKAPQFPWNDEAEERSKIVPIVPTPDNQVSAWGTLPLSPLRSRVSLPPLRARSGPGRVVTTAG